MMFVLILLCFWILRRLGKIEYALMEQMEYLKKLEMHKIENPSSEL